MKKIQNVLVFGIFVVAFLIPIGLLSLTVGPSRWIANYAKKAVDKFAYDASIKVAVHSKILDDVLEKIGITSLEDFKDPKKINMLEREF